MPYVLIQKFLEWVCHQWMGMDKMLLFMVSINSSLVENETKQKIISISFPGSDISKCSSCVFSQFVKVTITELSPTSIIMKVFLIVFFYIFVLYFRIMDTLTWDFHGRWGQIKVFLAGIVDFNLALGVVVHEYITRRQKTTILISIRID